MSKNERDRLREEIEEKDKKENEVREAYREALCKKNKAINDRFREKVIMPLKEELLPNSWECFINGLVVQSYKNKTITLFHPDRAEWVIEYYLERIKELMPGITVNITSEMK